MVRLRLLFSAECLYCNSQSCINNRKWILWDTQMLKSWTWEYFTHWDLGLSSLLILAENKCSKLSKREHNEKIDSISKRKQHRAKQETVTKERHNKTLYHLFNLFYSSSSKSVSARQNHSIRHQSPSKIIQRRQNKSKRLNTSIIDTNPTKKAYYTHKLIYFFTSKEHTL